VRPGITVVIPTHPGREDVYDLAVRSVGAQELLPLGGIEAVADLDHAGAAATRDRGLQAVRTEWTAFLDSDDVMYPQHLAVLMNGAREHEADYVYSWYDVINRDGRVLRGVDPLGHFGRPFDPERPTQTTITVLVRTELAQLVGFQAPEPGAMVDGQVAGEDWRFTLGCIAAGAKIVHVPERTWGWRHWGVGQPGRPGNTSGRPDRW
jgi:hypothetical protein